MYEGECTEKEYLDWLLKKVVRKGDSRKALVVSTNCNDYARINDVFNNKLIELNQDFKLEIDKLFYIIDWDRHSINYPDRYPVDQSAKLNENLVGFYNQFTKDRNNPYIIITYPSFEFWHNLSIFSDTQFKNMPIYRTSEDCREDFNSLYSHF